MKTIASADTTTVPAADGTRPTATGATTPGSSPGSNAEIREAWLRGNVSMHQDATPDPTRRGAPAKGQDITGEALYLINRGEGKVLAWVYQRNPDPKDGPPRPGPLPMAKVSTDDMTIEGEILRMDQEHDKVWADGTGKLTQWTDRALLTDKAAAPPPAANSEGNTAESVDRKIAKYFEYGGEEVWVIEPKQRRALVYERSKGVRIEDRAIRSGLLPGIEIPFEQFL